MRWASQWLADLLKSEVERMRANAVTLPAVPLGMTDAQYHALDLLRWTEPVSKEPN